MKTTMDYILDYFESCNEQVKFADSYGELGYEVNDDNKGILLMNWNNVHEVLSDYIEDHYNIEWSDEWIVSGETNRAYRTAPDSMFHVPYYWITPDGEVVGGDEIENESHIRDEYIVYLTDNPDEVNYFNIDWEAEGFTLLPNLSLDHDACNLYNQLKHENPNMDIIIDGRESPSNCHHTNAWGRIPTNEGGE